MSAQVIEVTHNVTTLELTVPTAPITVEVENVSPTTIEIIQAGTQGVGLPGADGAQGPPGEPGSLAIGEVIVSNEMAAAEIIGEPGSQILNLTLPRGFKGEDSTVPGPEGPPNNLIIGEISISDEFAAVEIVGTYPNQTLNFTVPRGPQGVQGSQGPAGTGTITSVNGQTDPTVVIGMDEVLANSLNLSALPTWSVPYLADDQIWAVGPLPLDALDQTGVVTYFRSRANHTGTQAISTIVNLQSTLDGKAASSHTHTASNITDFSSTVAGLITGKENTITAGTTAQYWRGDKSWQTLNSTAVGLGNVNNTSDANKPVSIAQQAALDLKSNLSEVVLLTGDQTIAGNKTFSGAIVAASYSGVGTSLTALNASNLSSGTVAQARIIPNIVRVVHGATASTARPTGVTYVEWVGSVTPTNAVDGDTWVNTTA